MSVELQRHILPIVFGAAFLWLSCSILGKTAWAQSAVSKDKTASRLSLEISRIPLTFWSHLYRAIQLFRNPFPGRKEQFLLGVLLCSKKVLSSSWTVGKCLIAFNHLCPPPCFVTFSLLLTPEILCRASHLSEEALEQMQSLHRQHYLQCTCFIDLNLKNQVTYSQALPPGILSLSYLYKYKYREFLSQFLFLAPL